MSVTPEKTDAGLRELDHYKSRLPRWRYAPRQWLLPLVRYETPYVAALQDALRTPTLDAYFSITANLGTHTFFMIFLPILAWCGNPVLCRGLCHILGAGVFITGFIKDLLCLPRPLSPPLQRISMSKSAALEYGFPSTHSANALSVAVYALLALTDKRTDVDPTLKIILQTLAGTYSVSIVLGRLYCGMHGFLDVVIGSILGSVISLVQYNYIDTYDDWLLTNGLTSLSIVLLLVVAVIRVHPEPADDCPCFDDSVAFAGVILGIDMAQWFHAQRLPGAEQATVAAIPFDFAKLGLFVSTARIVIGVAIVLVWRMTAKKLLLAILPPLFRIISKAGFLLPRRFFKQAPEYDQVPAGIQMDTLIPPISRIPEFVRSIANPRKNRSVSIGPQSYADAYETLAYRQKVRRESNSRLTAPGPMVAPAGTTDETRGDAGSYFAEKPGQQRTAATGAQVSGMMPPTPASSSTNLKEQGDYLDPGPAVFTPATPGDSIASVNRSRTSSADRREREEERAEEKAVFASLPKPRTKFDIEIVTKLIVYSGIAFFAVGLVPLLFEATGLV